MPRCSPRQGRGGPLAAIPAGLVLVVAALAWQPSAAWAQKAIEAAIQRPGALSPEKRAELYRQLRTQAEYFEKQSALVKTAAKLVGPTVVHIEADVTRRPALQVGPGRPGPSRQVEENGSGVVIEWGGKSYILTSRHVVAGAAPKAIKINLADGRRIYPQKVWDDVETDVAVMAVSAPDLVAAQIGNSDAAEIGDFVLAIGNPFGLMHSVTFGIISAKGRRNLELGDAGISWQDFLQTDAAINPGNSGGPLINLRGEVVGINTCIASNSGGNEGIGFAIPVNLFMFVARQLIETGKVSRAFLGVTLDRDFGPAVAAELGLPRASGAKVARVFENSPAAAAGIRERDVILRFEDTAVENDGHLINLVGMTKIGKRVALLVFRDGEMLTIHATVDDATKYR